MIVMLHLVMRNNFGNGDILQRSCVISVAVAEKGWLYGMS